MSDKCRSCQAPIIWATSATTRRPMPLDAKPEKRVVIDEHHLARVVDTYTSHFSTCPQQRRAWAAQQRGAKKTKATTP